jgi:hypothetical protein
LPANENIPWDYVSWVFRGVTQITQVASGDLAKTTFTKAMLWDSAKKIKTVSNTLANHNYCFIKLNAVICEVCVGLQSSPCLLCDTPGTTRIFNDFTSKIEVFLTKVIQVSPTTLKLARAQHFSLFTFTFHLINPTYTTPLTVACYCF